MVFEIFKSCYSCSVGISPGDALLESLAQRHVKTAVVWILLSGSAVSGRNPKSISRCAPVGLLSQEQN